MACQCGKTKILREKTFKIQFLGPFSCFPEPKVKSPRATGSLWEDCAPGTGVPEFRSTFWNAGGTPILFERVSKVFGTPLKSSVPICVPVRDVYNFMLVFKV